MRRGATEIAKRGSDAEVRLTATEERVTEDEKRRKQRVGREGGCRE